MKGQTSHRFHSILSSQVFIIFFLGFSLSAFAAPVTKSAGSNNLSHLDQTLHRIFISEEFEPRSVGPVRWLDGGTAYTTLKPSASGKGKDIVRYDCATGRSKVLVTAAQLTPKNKKVPLKIDDYSWSKDQKRLLIYTNAVRVWRKKTRGDYWLFDLRSGVLRNLGGNVPPSTLKFATFSPDGSRVAYVHQHNLYVEDAVSGKITPLTTNGSATLINGTSDWVSEEELFIRKAFRWSPDGRSIAYWQFNTSGVGQYTLIYDTGAQHKIVTHIPYPQYGIYPHIQRYAYPEAGTTNSAVRVGVVSASGGPTRWMRVPGDPRNNYIPAMNWAGNSSQLVIERLNRLQNRCDVLLADVHTGAVKRIFRDQDKTWVESMPKFYWLPGNKDLVWLSERDGWRHAYAVPRDGGEPRLLTPGAFDVIDLEGSDPQGRFLYFIASPYNAGERYLYRVPLTGTPKPERVTPPGQKGTNSYQISPDYRWAIHTYSTFNTPPVIDLISLPDHKSVRVLEDNHALREKLGALRPGSTKFFRVDIGGGVKLDGWMIYPRGFNPHEKYPLLVNVYGEPAAQTVLNRWGGNWMLFHFALANQGYVIMSVDNRGTSAPRGAAWRKAIYGSLGPLSSKEQAAALVAVEHSRSYIDANRVAVWGWSGGGSNTLNLMFRYPDLYKVGMAVAPVPDQRLYDTIYQERYMGLPQDNPDGYRRGSPINFAAGLKGSLLIVHGSGDDNVHFQGSELLVNRLIQLGKTFDFMDYPGRTHSLEEGKGTHYNLAERLARFLEEHLPPGHPEMQQGMSQTAPEASH